MPSLRRRLRDRAFEQRLDLAGEALERLAVVRSRHVEVDVVEAELDLRDERLRDRLRRPEGPADGRATPLCSAIACAGPLRLLDRAPGSRATRPGASARSRTRRDRPPRTSGAAPRPCARRVRGRRPCSRRRRSGRPSRASSARRSRRSGSADGAARGGGTLRTSSRVVVAAARARLLVVEHAADQLDRLVEPVAAARRGSSRTGTRTRCARSRTTRRRCRGRRGRPRCGRAS